MVAPTHERGIKAFIIWAGNLYILVRDNKFLLARIIFRMEGGNNDDELVAGDCL
jgi:hypothetical protein